MKNRLNYFIAVAVCILVLTTLVFFVSSSVAQDPGTRPTQTTQCTPGSSQCRDTGSGPQQRTCNNNGQWGDWINCNWGGNPYQCSDTEYGSQCTATKSVQE